MVSFLFWNLAKNSKTFASISQLAITHDIDVFLLAECPGDVDSIATDLRMRGRGEYAIVDRGVAKVRGISRLPASDFFPHFNNENGDMMIWNLAGPKKGRFQVQVAVVHLLSRAGGAKPEDQCMVASAIAREVSEYEEREGCWDTVLVGDLNMNPFDPGMVIVSGFHAVMTKKLAELPDRRWRKEGYRRFYNPMWGLFGDQIPGPPGTHYWGSSITSNQHWHILDQVLLRPSVMDLLENVRILDHDGLRPLVDDAGLAKKEYLSDHLPILFSLDV